MGRRKILYVLDDTIIREGDIIPQRYIEVVNKLNNTIEQDSSEDNHAYQIHSILNHKGLDQSKHIIKHVLNIEGKHSITSKNHRDDLEDVANILDNSERKTGSEADIMLIKDNRKEIDDFLKYKDKNYKS